MAPKRKPLALGPGSLILGETNRLLDISCQVTAASISFEADSEDSLPTLCGGVIAGERNYTATLGFTAAQDLEKDGLIDWTWTMAGQEVPFTFTPRDDEAAKVVGRVIIDPVTIGGDVKKRNTSEAEFVCVDIPVFTPDETDDSTDYTAPVVTA